MSEIDELLNDLIIDVSNEQYIRPRNKMKKIKSIAKLNIDISKLNVDIFIYKLIHSIQSEKGSHLIDTSINERLYKNKPLKLRK